MNWLFVLEVIIQCTYPIYLQACANGFYGDGCSLSCGNCAGGEACNHIDGICPSGCEAGWVVGTCSESQYSKYSLSCTFPILCSSIKSNNLLHAIIINIVVSLVYPDRMHKLDRKVIQK